MTSCGPGVASAGTVTEPVTPVGCQVHEEGASCGSAAWSQSTTQSVRPAVVASTEPEKLEPAPGGSDASAKDSDASASDSDASACAGACQTADTATAATSTCPSRPTAVSPPTEFSPPRRWAGPTRIHRHDRPKGLLGS